MALRWSWFICPDRAEAQAVLCGLSFILIGRTVSSLVRCTVAFEFIKCLSLQGRPTERCQVLFVSCAYLLAISTVH